MYEACSLILAKNNAGQDIKTLVEAISHRVNSEKAEALNDEGYMERVIKYLQEELRI